jgi:hypothetical protein
MYEWVSSAWHEYEKDTWYQTPLNIHIRQPHIRIHAPTKLILLSRWALSFCNI